MTRNYEIGDIVRYPESKCVNFINNKLFEIVSFNATKQSTLVILRIDIGLCKCTYCYYYNGRYVYVNKESVEIVQTRLERERADKIKKLLSGE
jgi:hypothetical protein